MFKNYLKYSADTDYLYIDTLGNVFWCYQKIAQGEGEEITVPYELVVSIKLVNLKKLIFQDKSGRVYLRTTLQKIITKKSPDWREYIGEDVDMSLSNVIEDFSVLTYCRHHLLFFTLYLVFSLINILIKKKVFTRQEIINEHSR